MSELSGTMRRRRREAIAERGSRARRPWPALLPAAWLFAGPIRPASAQSVADEVSAGSSQPTPANPRSSFVGETLTGLFNEDGKVLVRADLGVTHDAASPAPPGSEFRDRGGNIFSIAAGPTWQPNDHFFLGASVDVSPTNTTAASTTVTFANQAGMATDTTAQLVTRASSVGGVLSAGYDTAGDSALETSVLGSASVGRFSSLQKINAVEEKNGEVVSTQRLQDYCRMQKCPRQLLKVLRAAETELVQASLSLGAVETVYETTDVGLSGTYYVYDQDPTQVGYFSFMTIGRRSASFGQGLSIEPLSFSVSPTLAHAFGRLRVAASYQFGQYYGGTGDNSTVGVKLQYKFGHRLKAWLSGVGQRDRESDGTTSRTGSLALGAKVSF